MKIVNTFLLFLLSLINLTAQKVNESSTFTMALTGDAIITRKLSVYTEPEFLSMIDIIRKADIAYTNLEMLFHDYESYPAHKGGGTYMRAAPELAGELVWAGFDMVSRANNHTGDYGVEGMRLTTKYVREAGLTDAGEGESLPAAREAHFRETGKARVALISCASTYPDHIRAGKSRGDIPSRPGLNPLRFNTTYYVTKPQFDSLVSVSVSAGLIRNPYKPDQQIVNSARILGQTFKISDSCYIHTRPNAEDLSEIGAVVRNASGLADYTIVSMHGHEKGSDNTIPAEFMVTFARAMVDAGADVIVGQGPHELRGIEIYKGKVILYSLGDFMFQNETLDRLPYENYERYNLGDTAHVADFNSSRYSNDTRGFPARPEIWESVIALPEWREGKLISLRLIPISLGFGEKRTVRGRPMLADTETGKKIITNLAKLSEPFGTRIIFRNGEGQVVIEE